MTVSPQYVAKHFEELSSAVEHGEVMEAAVPEKASLRLVVPSQVKQTRVLGAGKAIVSLPSVEELEQIDREWKQAIEDKVIG